MDTRRWTEGVVKRPKIACLIAEICCAVFLWLSGPAAAEQPVYVGSAVCSSCHADASAAWAGSDHALAWTAPTEAHVLGDFGDVAFEHAGMTARFFREGAKFMIEAEGGDGQRRAWEVVGVAGIDPLQQYLISPEPGRTQVFDIAWDVQKKAWYPVFPNQDASPGNGFHWTGPYKSWEARCAECHATGYSRNYDQTTRTYRPELAEIGVGCEACHGPGSAHLDWARDPAEPLAAAGLTSTGLTVDLAASQQAEVQQCLTCHSLREAMADGNPLPGTPYFDSFAISLLREGQYHADGAIQSEVFEGGSFLQSKMFGKGVRCSDCHDPHSGALLAEGNDVCAQCHSPAGNPRFPSLPLKVFDGPEHHFHPDGSAGAQCVSCHMIERTYMGIDTRRDHSFRIPRPDLAPTGSPDACTDCHTEKDAVWAAAELEARFPDSVHRGPHYATTIAAARRSPETQVQALLALAEWDGPGIVRATALELLAPLGHVASVDRVAELLADPDPMVRGAAAGALRGLPPQERLQRLQPVLTDPMRSVRVAAARALLDAAPVAGTQGSSELAAAMTEWQNALRVSSDFPETHLQIGGAALTVRNWQVAVGAFQEAVILDPQLVPAWAMIVRILAATGNQDAARQTLQQALAFNPDDQGLLGLAGEVGGLPAPANP